MEETDTKGHLRKTVVFRSLSRVQLCNPTDCSPSDSSVLHYVPEFVQIHVHLRKIDNKKKRQMGTDMKFQLLYNNHPIAKIKGAEKNAK